MNSHESTEVGFWNGLFDSVGAAEFLKWRERDWKEKTDYFQPELDKETGLGVDVGSGMLSIFEFRGNKDSTVFAVEPLLSEYNKKIQLDDSTVEYIGESGENMSFADSSLDFAFCCNVIDHTPDPKKMAQEIWRVLKPGGRFFFEINFDDELSPAHYDLWNKGKVNEVFEEFKDWEIVREAERRNPSYAQSLYEMFLIKK